MSRSGPDISILPDLRSSQPTVDDSTDRCGSEPSSEPRLTRLAQQALAVPGERHLAQGVTERVTAPEASGRPRAARAFIFRRVGSAAPVLASAGVPGLPRGVEVPAPRASSIGTGAIRPDAEIASDETYRTQTPRCSQPPRLVQPLAPPPAYWTMFHTAWSKPMMKVWTRPSFHTMSLYAVPQM
jgi:hypothetical protein